MKTQSFYLVASTLAGVFGVPLAKPVPKPNTVTYYETVVHMVSTTQTVWVPASTGTPGDCDTKPTPGSESDMYNKQPQPPTPQATYNNVTSNPQPVPQNTVPKEKSNYVLPPPAQNNSNNESNPEPKPEPKPETIYTPPKPIIKDEKPYVPPPPKTSTPEPNPEDMVKPASLPPPPPHTYTSVPKPEVKVQSMAKVKPVSSPPPQTYTPPPPPPVVKDKPVSSPPPPQTYTPSEVKVQPMSEVKPASSTQIVGQATFYAPGLGSCGITSTDGDDIVAIPHGLMEAKSNGNPNNNPLCGKKVIASRGGKSVTCTVVDTCPGCDDVTLDMSPHAFDVLGQPAEGRIPITWSWVDSY